MGKEGSRAACPRSTSPTCRSTAVATIRSLSIGWSWAARAGELGIAAGLDQFGVNLTTLKPGAASALRHWHEKEDELVYVLNGEVVLVEDGGETPLKAGDAAGFKANVPNGHHLINRSDRDAVYLEIGTRSKHERAEYPDVDMRIVRDDAGARYTHKDGKPYS